MWTAPLTKGTEDVLSASAPAMNSTSQSGRAALPFTKHDLESKLPVRVLESAQKGQLLREKVSDFSDRVLRDHLQGA